MSSDDVVIRIQQVVRAYRSGKDKVDALRGLSLEAPRGSVFGLIGRNGAGKTTAIRVLLGLLRVDTGRSTVLGEDSGALSADVRRRIGYLSEEPFPYDDVPIVHLLSFLSAFFPAWDADAVESLADRMAVSRGRTLDELSFGERRRTELFLALAPKPELLILDDPWLGLDAVARKDFLDVALTAAREDGVTILFTSHVLSDVERIADRVAILDHGVVRLAGPLDELKARTKRVVIEVADAEDAATIVVPGEVRRDLRDGTLSVTTTAFGADLERVLARRSGDVVVENLNLEALFVELTGSVPTTAESRAS
jgi:ABC-2 type transport system ATP-binding protein